MSEHREYGAESFKPDDMGMINLSLKGIVFGEDALSMQAL